jgi:hypothetical protein
MDHTDSDYSDSDYSDTSDYEHRIYHILNDWSKMHTFKKLKECDIDNIVDIDAKISLLIYYNYFDKLNEFSTDQLISAHSKICDNDYLFLAMHGKLETMKYLEKIGIDIHIKDAYGNNAYLLAASSGHFEIMRFLETKGLDIYITNESGYNAYLYAASGGYLEILKYLTEKEFDIHSKTNYGNNAYLLAAYININTENRNDTYSKKIETMKYLEETEIDIYLTNNDGKNALNVNRSHRIEIHLYTLGFLPGYNKLNMKHVYDRKIKKFIKIYNDESDIQYECHICRCNIILNDKYLKCNFNHIIHDKCYEEYCDFKKEIKCDCIICPTKYI